MFVKRLLVSVHSQAREKASLSLKALLREDFLMASRLSLGPVLVPVPVLVLVLTVAPSLPIFLLPSSASPHSLSLSLTLLPPTPGATLTLCYVLL